MTRRTTAQALMLTVLALRFAPQAAAAPPGATPTDAMRRAARVLISTWQPQSGVPRTLWLGQNGKLTPLLRDNSYKGSAALSPLGDKIAFLGDVSHDIADGEIDVIDLQGHSLSKTLLDTNNASPQLRKWYPELDPKLQSVPIDWESLAWVGNRDDTVAVSGSYNYANGFGLVIRVQPSRNGIPNLMPKNSIWFAAETGFSVSPLATHVVSAQSNEPAHGDIGPCTDYNNTLEIDGDLIKTPKMNLIAPLIWLDETAFATVVLLPKNQRTVLAVSDIPARLKVGEGLDPKGITPLHMSLLPLPAPLVGQHASLYQGPANQLVIRQFDSATPANPVADWVMENGALVRHKIGFIQPDITDEFRAATGLKSAILATYKIPNSDDQPLQDADLWCQDAACGLLTGLPRLSAGEPATILADCD